MTVTIAPVAVPEVKALGNGTAANQAPSGSAAEGEGGFGETLAAQVETQESAAADLRDSPIASDGAAAADSAASSGSGTGLPDTTAWLPLLAVANAEVTAPAVTDAAEGELSGTIALPATASAMIATATPALGGPGPAVPDETSAVIGTADGQAKPGGRMRGAVEVLTLARFARHPPGLEAAEGPEHLSAEIAPLITSGAATLKEATVERAAAVIAVSGDTPIVRTEPVAAAAVGATAAPPEAQPSRPASLSVAVPTNQAGWDDAIGERIIWMATQQVQEAEIRLNPPQLGPLEVRVSVQNDQANVSFSTHSPAVREALEAAMPRLREMLAGMGLNMQDANVAQHGAGHRRESSEGFSGNRAEAEGADLDELTALGGQHRSHGLGLIDYYA